MTKKDIDNPEYTGKVLCSPGLGAGYIKRIGKRHEWNEENTKEDYYTKQGTYIALPKYYKYKLFTEDQREQLWIYRENSGEKFIGNLSDSLSTMLVRRLLNLGIRFRLVLVCANRPWFLDMYPRCSLVHSLYVE